MRIIQHDQKYCFFHRPFQDSLGTAVYIGTGAEPDSVEYRSNRIPDGSDFLIPGINGINDFGGTNVKKTKAVAFAKSPAKPSYVLPANLADSDVWFQVRTHESDVENESIYGERKLSLDTNLDDANLILGSGYVMKVERRDSGGMKLHFAWNDSSDGIIPTDFVLTKTAGPVGTISVSVSHSAGQRLHAISVSGLQDAQVYTFELKAKNGTTELVIDNAILFTADAAGPPVPSSVSVEEY